MSAAGNSVPDVPQIGQRVIRRALQLGQVGQLVIITFHVKRC